MTDLDVPGPIDFVLLEFPGDAVGNAMADAIADLIQRGTIRLYDIVVVLKLEDGEHSTVDLSNPSLTSVASLQPFLGARSGLLTEDDVATAAATLANGTVGLMLVYENSWAIPFAQAALDQGGQVVTTERIGVQDVIAVLDELDAANAAN